MRRPINPRIMPGVLLCGASLLAPVVVWANDGISAAAGGGIVLGKTDAIAMKKEVLEVSPDKISVDYDFVNESDRDRTESIMFPLPGYPANVDPHPTHMGAPKHFSVTVDGKAVVFRTIVRASQNGHDITARLKEIGLSDQDIAWFTPFPETSPFVGKGPPENLDQKPVLDASQRASEPALSGAQRTALRTAGFTDETPDKDIGPQWTVNITYLWTQTFPARRNVHVHHEYKPFPEEGAAMSQLDPIFDATYCIDPAFRATWKKLADRGNGELWASGVAYILKTANSWKNGIEDFTLNIIKSDPRELVSLCFPEHFQKVDDRTISVHLTNFRPTEDLNVYFGNRQ